MQENGFSMKKRSILALVAMLSVSTISMPPVLAQAQPATKAESAAKSGSSLSPVKDDAAEPEVKPLKQDEKIVKINGTEYSVLEFTALTVLRPNPDERLNNPFVGVPLLRGDRLESFAKNVGAYDIIAAKGNEEKLEFDDREKKSVDDMVKNWRQYLVAKSVVDDKMGEPTKEDLDKIYEAEKEKAYKIREMLRLKQIFVSTYVDYTVKAGDSLESIAREVGGDEKLADEILDDATKRPRAEKKLPAAEEKKDEAGEKKGEELNPRALQEGEKLKVPVHGEKEAAAKAKITAAYERLKAGEKFEDVAKEVSENENPGQTFMIQPESGDRPIMPELQKAFMALEDGKFSEPVRTRHGFSIIYRESYQPKSYKERDKSEDDLKARWMNKRRTELVDSFFTAQLKNPEITQILSDKLKEAKAENGESTIFVKIGDKDFALSQFTAEAQAAIKTDKDDSVDLLAGVLRKEPAIQQAIVEAYTAKQNLDETPIIKFVKEKQIASVMARKVITKEIEEKTKNITQEEKQKWYDESKERLRIPEMYEVYRIETKLSGEALEKEVSGIQNVEDFKTKADELAPPAADAPTKGGAMGKVTLDRFSEGDSSAISAVTVPGISKVVSIGEGSSHVFWVQAKEESRLPTLEEKNSQAEVEIKRMKAVETNKAIMDDAKSKVAVELLVK